MTRADRWIPAAATRPHPNPLPLGEGASATILAVANDQNIYKSSDPKNPFPENWTPGYGNIIDADIDNSAYENARDALLDRRSDILNTISRP